MQDPQGVLHRVLGILRAGAEPAREALQIRLGAASNASIAPASPRCAASMSMVAGVDAFMPAVPSVSRLYGKRR
jgi:hypothetical protein